MSGVQQEHNKRKIEKDWVPQKKSQLFLFFGFFEFFGQLLIA